MKNLLKKLSLLIIVIITSNSYSQINSDYDKSTDFTKYNSYSYFANMNTGLSELDTKRFFNVLDDAMALKGFTLAEDSDFIINIESTIYQEPQSSSSVGVGVGSGGGGVSVGIPIGQGSISRQIKFDFVDAETNQLFWQAISSEADVLTDNPEQREEKFKNVVAKVLEGFPPKK